MTRKLQKTILKEGQRRSPRISAMEAGQTHRSVSRLAGDPVVRTESKNASTCKDKTRRDLDDSQGPAFRTTGRKKRKLRPVEELTASSPPKQGGKQSDDEDIQKKSDQPSNSPSATFMPEKHILELVLNVLQRRDTHEIFAEPVDPKEVEDYYEIIEEPMDFGTMRAKLHEGMYESLEQFEHDVFLIFNNAMHFNSSGTIYFRQARAINELAKKVFNVLKNNPENFELEFSETRHRVGRRNQGDLKDSTNVKFSESTIGVSSKIMPCSSNATSNRKSFKSNHGRSDIAKHVDARDLEVPMGSRDIGRYTSFEGDKRCTYRPSLPLCEDDSIFPTVHSKLKLLEPVNRQDIGYRESLMLFVKDLGQAAQNIARGKLLGCEIHTASGSSPWRPNTRNTGTALMCQNPMNRFPNDDIDHAKTLNAGRGNARSPIKEHVQESQRMSLQDKNYWSNFYGPKASADKLNCSVDGSQEPVNKCATVLLDKSKLVNQVQVSEYAIEHSQTVLDSRLENKRTRDVWSFIQDKSQMQNLRSEHIQGDCEDIAVKCATHDAQLSESAIEHSQTALNSRFENRQARDVSSFIHTKSQMHNTSLEHIRGDCEDIAVKCATYKVSCSSEAGKTLQSDQTVPLASSFIFNLPYLKTRLHQISSSQHDSGGKRPFSVGGLTCNQLTDMSSAIYSHNQQPSLLNYQRTDSSPSL